MVSHAASFPGRSAGPFIGHWLLSVRITSPRSQEIVIGSFATEDLLEKWSLLHPLEPALIRDSSSRSMRKKRFFEQSSSMAEADASVALFSSRPASHNLAHASCVESYGPLAVAESTATVILGRLGDKQGQAPPNAQSESHWLLALRMPDACDQEVVVASFASESLLDEWVAKHPLEGTPSDASRQYRCTRWTKRQQSITYDALTPSFELRGAHYSTQIVSPNEAAQSERHAKAPKKTESYCSN
jgi:hypothetical protein